jgi:hypothetical protein
LFYISASEGTAILEKKPNQGDALAVLRCKLKSNDKKPHVMELGIAEMTSLHGVQSTTQLLENTRGGRVYMATPENIQKNLAIRSFLAKEFLRTVEKGKEEEFKITIAIAEILMQHDKIDGVSYPSRAGNVSKWQGGENMALKPKSADLLYDAQECWVSVVEKLLPGDALAMRCIQKAKTISPTGEVIW